MYVLFLLYNVSKIIVNTYTSYNAITVCITVEQNGNSFVTHYNTRGMQFHAVVLMFFKETQRNRNITCLN